VVNKSIIVAHQITTGFNYEEEEQVKKKILLIPLALLLAISLVAIGCPAPPEEEVPPPPPPEEEVPPPPPPPPAKDKIVIGASRSLSGPGAIIESSAFGPIMNMWIEDVNARGGIYVEEYGKKLPIEAIIYDDKTDLGTMTRLVEKLILEDKVDFLFPPVGTSFLFAAAPVANKYGYVLIGAEGGCTTVTDMLPELPYVFATLNYSDHYQMPVLADLFEDWGVKTVAIIYIADLHGIEYSHIAHSEFLKKGINIVVSKSVPQGTIDLSPLLKEAKSLEVDAFCSFTYPPDSMLVTAQAIELGFNPKVFEVNVGPCFAWYRDIFGAVVVEGLIGPGAWNAKSSPGAAEFYDKFVARYGEPALDYWGHLFYWGGLQFFEQAVVKAGTLDQAVIRDTIATETFDTVLGPTWFETVGGGGGLLAVECHPGEIGQWQSGVFEVIGPKEKATAEPIYPKPPWPGPPPE